MGKGYKHGGSGGANPLNFVVKAYPSEVELNTDTPNGNTLGVVTTNPIPGWYFDFKQPENMAEGEVWFLSGTNSTAKFNALKRNNIMVYPSGAKQMVSGVLKDVVAKCYQDEKWLDWMIYLFNDGKANETLTGGFEKFLSNSQGDAVINSDCIYITCKKYDSSWSGSTSFAAKNRIDLTQHTKLRAKGTYTGSYGGLDIGVSTAANPSSSSTSIAKATASTSGNFDLSVDLNSVEGEYYVYIRLWFYAENATSANLSATVTDLWLE